MYLFIKESKWEMCWSILSR